MSKRENKRKLELKRERLRQLTDLSTGDAGRVVGGTCWRTDENTEAGRVYSFGCRAY